jgi:hypothetical protein
MKFEEFANEDDLIKKINKCKTLERNNEVTTFMAIFKKIMSEL